MYAFILNLVVMFIIVMIFMTIYCMRRGMIVFDSGIDTIMLPNGRVEAIYKRKFWMVRLWKLLSQVICCFKTASQSSTSQPCTSQFTCSTSSSIEEQNSGDNGPRFHTNPQTCRINITEDDEESPSTYQFAKCTNYNTKKVETVVEIHGSNASSVRTVTGPLKTFSNGSRAVPPGSIPNLCTNLETLAPRREVPPFTITRPLTLQRETFKKCEIVKKLNDVMKFFDNFVLVIYFQDDNGNACYIDNELDTVPKSTLSCLKLAMEKGIWAPTRDEPLNYPMIPVQLALDHELRMVALRKSS